MLRVALMLSPADFERYRDIVRQRAGIEIPDARKGDLEKGIRAALQLTGASDAGALYRLLAGNAVHSEAAFEAIVPAITINETHFFRNRPQMEALETEILPQLIKARRATRRLRIWSAACSSGEEAYSLAILIDRLLPDRDDWDVLVHGTDIDSTALDKARAGVYGTWSFREVPPDVKERYFAPVDGNRLELAPMIRQMVCFSRLNLVEGRYPSRVTNTDRMDLVLCRNVLIYFREATIRRVADRLHDSLVDGGWLLVGHAEPSQAIFHRYEVANFPGAIIYRRPAPKAAAAPACVRALSPVADMRTARSEPKTDPVDDARDLFDSGRSGEAIKQLQELATESPKDFRAPYLLAKILASRMRFPEAERWIDVAIANRELAPEPHYLRGLVLQEQSRLEEALEAFRRCVFLDHGFVLGHFAAAGLFGRTGQTLRAQKSLTTVAELLASKPAGALLPEGDGLTVGGLMELVTVQRRLVA